MSWGHESRAWPSEGPAAEFSRSHRARRTVSGERSDAEGVLSPAGLGSEDAQAPAAEQAAEGSPRDFRHELGRGRAELFFGREGRTIGQHHAAGQACCRSLIWGDLNHQPLGGWGLWLDEAPHADGPPHQRAQAQAMPAAERRLRQTARQIMRHQLTDLRRAAAPPFRRGMVLTHAPSSARTPPRNKMDWSHAYAPVA